MPNPSLTALYKIPRHVAIIMDGNGRWAKSKGLPRIRGHARGVKTLKEIATYASDLGVAYLTLFSFSTENWLRPKLEVAFLMKLLRQYLKKERETFIKNNIRVESIGDRNQLPKEALASLNETIAATRHNRGMTFILALNYSGRDEIVHAVRFAAERAIKKDLSLENIDRKFVEEHLFTAAFPDPDLLIRTGGEFRVSNFLLWQMAYTELYFTDVMWPEFTKDDFLIALQDFQNRERRFGKLPPETP
jgi:undecaprenyl diphosphate synthase